MRDLDSSKIERLAVKAVNEIADRVNSMLKPEIPENDKSISFDGEIQVFKDTRETIETLIGKVPVQIKGKVVKEFSDKTRSYPIPMNHLKNYYDNQGVLYFVVELLQNGDSKIFYKQLLPLEIYSILNHDGKKLGKKSKSVEFRALEETSLYRVCRLFLREKKRQPLVLVEHEKNLEAEYSILKARSLTLTDSNISEIFQHDFALYGERDGIDFPLRSNMRLDTYTIKTEEKILINNKEYRFWSEYIKSKNGFTTRIYESSLRLTYKEDGSRFKVTLEAFNSLTSMLKVLPFFIDLLEGHTATFMDQTIQANIEESSTIEIAESIKAYYSFFTESIPTFEEVGIPFDKVVPGDFETIVKDINLLNQLFLEKDYSQVSVKLPQSGGFVNINIGDLGVAAFYNPTKQPKFINAFSTALSETAIAVSENENEERTPHSIYILASEKMLTHSINLKTDVIKSSFEKINPFLNDQISELTNHFCLNCIKSYDSIKRKDLLELARFIFEKKKNPEVIYELNLIQIKLRLNDSLDEVDIQRLLDIKHAHPDNHQILFGVNILLGNKNESNYHFTKLPEEDRDSFSTYPIFSLFENMK